MGNINDNISIMEARTLIEVINTLAKGCAFTKLELQQILSVCNKCLDRLEEDTEYIDALKN